ncbi:MAG: universal stress protein [Nitrospirae bacterium]|nr:universal stress protein [Nitrospirota bacterium]
MDYKNIMVAVDNSDYSNHGVDLGVEIAKAFGGAITGVHVFAAKLHDLRFRQMEGGLPEQFRFEGELEKQREIHDTLITKGLNIITDSYLDAVEERCRGGEIALTRKSLEGKNYKVLAEDIGSSRYDMVILGAIGLGVVKEKMLGSVCERVVRRVNSDILVTRNNTQRFRGGKILVGVDGSPESFGALQIALSLSQKLSATVEVVSAYDPYFHYAAFNSIAKVLSEEAGKIFRFKQQEQLHEEIIDEGLAKIYRAHLEVAKGIARDMGVDVKTTLLAGKPYDAILGHARKEKPALLILGKVGVHQDEGLDIGSNTENLLRLAPCHVLLTTRKFVPPLDEVARHTISWTKEAEARMERVPSFVKNMARMAILRYAQDKGHTVISSSIVDEAMSVLMPRAAMEAMSGGGRKSGMGARPMPGMGTPGPTVDDERILWEEDALKELQKIEDLSVREQIRLRIEKLVRIKGMRNVTKGDVMA